MAYLRQRMFHANALLAAVSTVVLFAGCTEVKVEPRFELRWCAYGKTSCVLNQKEGTYVRGGFFASLDRCNDAIRHLSFYGNKVGGTCVEIEDWERKKLEGGR